MLHIIRDNDRKYVVIDVQEIGESIVSVVKERFDTLAEANAYLIEDAMPVNAMSAGHVATFDPLLGKLKRILRRGKRNVRK